MHKVIEIREKYLVSIFIIISFLVLCTFWRSLDFYFWRDDWDLWSQQHYFWKILKVHNHPGTWVSRALLYHVLGWNSLAWQSLGIILRIFSSLAVALLMWGISKSKKMAVLSGVLYATTILGMETVTWSSVYIIPQVIILTCSGFYLWILFLEKKYYKYAAISILLFAIAVLADPGRAIFVVPMVALWEILNWWITEKREKIHVVIVRSALLVICLAILTRVSLFLFYQAPINIVDNIKQVIIDPNSLQTLFKSCGNLLLGWTQSSQGGNLDHLSLRVLIFLFLFSLVLVLVKKSKFGAILLLFTFWIPMLYIPNWIYNKNLIAPPTDRYLSFSAVGYIGILTLVLSSMKLRFLSYVALSIIIINNIITANKVLIAEANYRSSEVVKSVWAKIDRDIPKDEMNSIFVYLGDDYFKLPILDWSGSTPFGIKRGFTKYEDFPIATSDETLILKLLCEDNVYRPSMFDWIFQKQRIPISHVHVWEIHRGILKNISTEMRERLMKQAIFNNCVPRE